MTTATELSTTEQGMIVAVTINDRKLTDATLALRTIDNRFNLPTYILTDAHLALPPIPTLDHDGQHYYPLDAIPDLHAEFDIPTQTLKITVPPSSFIGTQYDANPNTTNHAPTLRQPETTGAFLNYDVNYININSSNHLSGLTELGIFGTDGTFTSRFIGLGQNNGATTFFRLDSQFTRDFPTQQATLLVGDGITSGSAFSRQVYFGGIQWRTKFSTIPGYQSIPLPILSGTAAAPSTADIYVNNILRSRQNVDTGPFSINNLPVYTGQGNLRMVVQDVLGREQIITQSYITSPQLLRQGLHDVSYELGALRNNFGLRDNRYGPVFASSTIRYGLQDTVTLEGHAEAMCGSTSLGLAGNIAINGIGLFGGGIASSHTNNHTDTLQYVQFERQNSLYGLSARAQTAGRHFWQLGLDDYTRAPAKQIQAQGNLAISNSISLSLGYINQVNHDLPNVRAVNAGINLNLRQAGTISIGLLKSMTPDRLLSLNMVWVIPLENQSMLQVTSSRQAHAVSAEYHHLTPQEGGWGYRLRQSVFEGTRSADVGLYYANDSGEYNLSANHVAEHNNLQTQARGGIVLLDTHVRTTRWLDQSFAMIEVPVSQAIDIYANNIRVGQTDLDGIGIVPRLVPYETNKVHLDDAGLPLSISLDLTQKSITPGPRTGILLKFHAQQNKGVTLVLMDENGNLLPTGTRIHIQGQADEQEVALRGKVFIPEMVFPTTLIVTGDNFVMQCPIPKPATEQALPILGPYICHPRAT